LVFAFSSCEKDVDTEEKKVDPIVGTWIYDTVSLVIAFPSGDIELNISDELVDMTEQDKVAFIANFSKITFTAKENNTIVLDLGDGLSEGIWIKSEDLYLFQDNANTNNTLEGNIVSSKFVITIPASELDLEDPVKSVKLYFKKVS
jgi:hypothetical protein